jgi:hypothetical protein
MKIDPKKTEMIRRKKASVAKYFEGTIGNGCYLKYVEEDNKRTLRELDTIEKNT